MTTVPKRRPTRRIGDLILRRTTTLDRYQRFRRKGELSPKEFSDPSIRGHRQSVSVKKARSGRMSVMIYFSPEGREQSRKNRKFYPSLSHELHHGIQGALHAKHNLPLDPKSNLAFFEEQFFTQLHLRPGLRKGPFPRSTFQAARDHIIKDQNLVSAGSCLGKACLNDAKREKIKALVENLFSNQEMRKHLLTLNSKKYTVYRLEKNEGQKSAALAIIDFFERELTKK